MMRIPGLRSVAAATLLGAAALGLSGCSLDGAANPLDLFGDVVQTGQDWWNGANEQLQSLGSAIESVVRGVDLSAIGDQVHGLCVAINEGAQSGDGIDAVARSLIKHATGIEPAEGQVRDLIRAATAHCPSQQ